LLAVPIADEIAEPIAEKTEPVVAAALDAVSFVVYHALEAVSAATSAFCERFYPASCSLSAA